MKKKVFITGTIVALISVAVATAMAGPGYGKYGVKGGGMRCMKGLMRNPELAENAGITAEQLKQLEDIHYASQKEQVQLRANVELAEIEMQRLMSADEVDKEAVLQAADRLGVAMQALRKAELGTMLDASQVLTDEQREAVQNAMRECRGKNGSDRRSGRGHDDSKKGRGRQGMKKGYEERSGMLPCGGAMPCRGSMGGQVDFDDDDALASDDD